MVYKLAHNTDETWGHVRYEFPLIPRLYSPLRNDTMHSDRWLSTFLRTLLLSTGQKNKEGQ